MKNQRSFRTKGRLKIVDNSVKVSKVIGKKDANGQEFYPSFTNQTVVLMTEDRKVYETTKATADGLGNLTFLKRGLADDGSDTEVAAFKRARAPGTYMFMTLGAEDYEGKQDKLTAGCNIQIDSCNVISATDTTYTAGNGIDITAGVISTTGGTGERGQITGCIDDQTDLQTVLLGKQDYLMAGSNIDITCNVISATDTTYQACDFDIKDLADSCSCKDVWNCKQDALTAGCNVTICSNTINAIVPTQACDIGALPDTTKYGASLDMCMDNSTYVLQMQLKDQDGCNLGSACCVDLPLESMVVCGDYNCCTKEIELTLQGGTEICFSVADLVCGLQTEITSCNKLCADYVDDSSSTNKFVTAGDLTTLSNTSGTNTGDQCSCDFDIKDLADTCCYRDVWNAKLGGGDNVSCLCNDAGYLTCSTLPGLNTQVVKIEISTSNGTAQKTATLTGYTPTAGDLILAHFKYGNSANNVSLNINNTGNKYIRLGGTIANANNFSIPNQTDMYAFLMYNGHSYNAYATDNTKYSASDFDIKNLADSSSCRTTWNNKLAGGDLKTINGCCLVGSGDICISGGGGGDMLACTYDPCGCSTDAFDYCNMYNTPTIPTDNCELSNSCGYTTCTGTLQSCDIATVNGCCLTSGGNICITGGSDYSRCTKTISGGEVEIGLRTIVNPPTSDFTLTVPTTIKEGEEYVIRTISETSYCMCLGSCITNPRNVNTCLSGNATDQYVFLAIGGELELQPLVATGS